MHFQGDKTQDKGTRQGDRDLSVKNEIMFPRTSHVETVNGQLKNSIFGHEK
jgi:hypothetical protein